MGKLISIIIPTYNRISYITEAIVSVLNQTYKNIEIIVVDDGSSDGTQTVLEEFIKNRQVRYFYQKNKGPGAARNLGIQNSRGEFIAFLDADDLWLSEKLEKQIRLFENQKIGLVYSDMDFFGDKSPFKKYSEMAKGFYRGDILKKLIKRNFIPISSAIVRREVFDKVGYFNEDFKNFPIGEDYEFWLRLAMIVKSDFIPEILVRYRIHKNQMSRGFVAENYRTLALIYRKSFKDTHFLQYYPLLLVRYLENKLKFLLASLSGL